MTKDPRSFIPDDPKKIRAKIRSYERLLAMEKALHGGYDDGYGKRYLLGPLYLFYGDMDAALKHFEWYEAAFPDDCNDPGQLLCWALVLLRAGKDDAAEMKLGQTMLANVHIIPHMLGQETVQPCRLEPTPDGWSDYVGMMPPEYFEIWTDAEKEWARDHHEGPYFSRIRQKWMEFDHMLEDEEPGEERTRLCNEKWALEKVFKDR